jgi:hypothetical protein
MPSPISSSTFLSGGGILVAFIVLQSVWRYQQKQRQCGNTPGYKLIIANTRQIIALLPVFRIPFTDNWYFNIGLGWWGNHSYDGRQFVSATSCILNSGTTIEFKAYGQDIISAVSFNCPSGFPSHFEFYGAGFCGWHDGNGRILAKFTLGGNVA